MRGAPTSDTQHADAAGDIRLELDGLYPGRWAHLLLPLCGPTPHEHNGSPCTARGKRPLEPGWNRAAVERWTAGIGREEHIDEIAQHVAAGGNVGMAIPPGALMLDADTPAAVSMLEGILPDAPMQRSSPGHGHFVVRVPAGLAIKATVRAEIAPGIFVDLRTAGRSQIAVQPSQHWTGTDYAWLRPLPETIEQLPACPPGLLAAIATKTRESVGTDIAEGGRNAGLTSLAGTMRRPGMGEAAILAALREENMRRCSPPLPDGEVKAIAASVSRYPAGGATSESADAGVWPEPLPLPPKTSVVPPLPEALLPEPLCPWLVDAARRACLPLEYLAVPALVGLSSLISRSLGIYPKRHDTGWLVVPNLWGGIVGRPGLMKTAAIKEGLSPLQPLIARARAQYEEEAAHVESEKVRLELEIKALIDSKKGDSATIADLKRELRECVAVERRYLTHDSTVEKLGVILNENPRGVLVVRDELAGWLYTLEKPGREGDRQFYLEAWNGTGSYTVDRIGRGTQHIRALCVSIVGGIQPARLQPFLEEALDSRPGADGLIQRFQLIVWPDEAPAWRNHDRLPDARERERVQRIYEAIDSIDVKAITGEALGEATGPDEIPAIHFAADAQDLFDTWRDDLERRLRSSELQTTPAFEGHLSKFRSLMPSLALIFALADAAEEGFVGFGGGVSLDAAQRAAAWCEYLEAHGRKLYAVELNPAALAAHELARCVRERLLADGMTVREIHRAEWRGLTREGAVRDGLDLLERLGWLRQERREPGPSGGRPSVTVRLSPRLGES